MLLQIKTTEQVEKTIELKTPCWLANRLGFYAHVTEAGDLIEVFGGTVSMRDATEPSTQIAIANLFTAYAEYHGCTEDEFREALNKRLFKLEETYTRA